MLELSHYKQLNTNCCTWIYILICCSYVILHIYVPYQSGPGSSVCIASDYGMDGPGSNLATRQVEGLKESLQTTNRGKVLQYHIKRQHTQHHERHRCIIPLHHTTTVDRRAQNPSHLS